MREILVLDIDITLPQSTSLKDKRRVRLSIVDKLKSQFNVSIIETSHLVDLSHLQLTLAYVSNTHSNTINMREKMIDVLSLIVDQHQGNLYIEEEIL